MGVSKFAAFLFISLLIATPHLSVGSLSLDKKHLKKSKRSHYSIKDRPSKMNESKQGGPRVHIKSSIVSTTKQENILKPAGIPPEKEEAYYRESFLPLQTKSMIGLFILASMLVIATLANNGGNVVILPVCLIFFSFSPRVAIAHSSFFCTISALCRVIYESIQKRNSSTKGKINYHMVLLAAPSCILGSFLGTNLTMLSPEIILMASILILQTGLLIFSLKEYSKLSENEEKAKKKLVEPVLLEELKKQESSRKKHQAEQKLEYEDQYEILNVDEVNDDEENLVRQRLNSSAFSSQQTEMKKKDYFLLVGFLLLAPIFEYLRGNSIIHSVVGNKYCTKTDAIIVGGYILVLVFMSVVCREIILRRNKYSDLTEDDLNITPKFTIKFMFSMLVVSIVGGFISSGSSTLIALTILKFGLSPFHASSTGLVVVIIFSGSSSLVYMFNGYIYPSCAVIGGLVVITATMLTRVTIYQSFLKHGKASMILLFISIMMIITTPSNIIKVAPHIIQEYRKGNNILAFKDFCSY